MTANHYYPILGTKDRINVYGMDNRYVTVGLNEEKPKQLKLYTAPTTDQLYFNWKGKRILISLLQINW